MFEQSLYQQPPVPMPSEDVDLFNNYEIKTWERSSRLYKILGISAIGNVFALLIIAQTSLLTMKGCDSPLVGRVCSVLDTVYVGSLLFGTDREFIDAAYDQTKIGDDEEITFIDVSAAEPRFTYPSDYDKYANPEKFAAQQAGIDPLTGLPLSNGMGDIDDAISMTPPLNSGGSLLDTPQVLPPSNPDVVAGNLPQSFDSGTPSYKPPRPKKTPRIKNPGNLPDIDDNAVAANPSPSPTPEPLPTPMTSDAIKAVEINKKPLVDFADDVAVRWAAKEVDLNQEFAVVLNAVLAPDGSLDLKNSKFDVAKQKGDAKMIDIGKSALEALGKSGYLVYLKNLNVEKFVATLVQDDKHITIVIASAQKTPEMAKTIASGLNSAIMIGKTVTDDPSDERTLLNGAKVTADGKSFVLNFAIPKPIAQEMINRKLTEAQAKKAQQPKPSGNIPVRAEDRSAGK